MRYLVTVLFCALIISGTVSAAIIKGGNKGSSDSGLAVGDTVKIISSPELTNLINEWIREFSKTQPLVNFQMAEMNSSVPVSGSLYFLTDRSSAEITDRLDWKLTIGHNAVVPVLSRNNPRQDELLKRGLTPNELGTILTSGLKWSDLLVDGSSKPLNVYARDDQGIKSILAEFAGKELSEVRIIPASGTEELLSLLEKDPDGIAFSRLNDIKKPGVNELSGNIILLPIDKNMNGRIDNFEKIYDTPDDLSRGLWIGKYPRSLSGSIYLMSGQKPAGSNQVAFLSWIMNDGVRFYAENGFTDPGSSEKEAILAALTPSVATAAREAKTTPNIWVTLILCTVVAGALLVIALGLPARKRSAATESTIIRQSGINPEVVLSPGGLYYDKSHTWAFMEKDGLIRMGIDDFLQHVTGDISKIMLKEPGSVVRRGEQVLTLIRDGKQLNLYAPVSGTIKALNTDLLLDSSIINSSPYSDGWVYLIEPRNWAREIQLMFMAEKYRQWIDEEFIRLKNFFAATLIPSNTLPGYVIMQDGGELKENPLADLDPEVWEEFQIRFIDVSK